MVKTLKGWGKSNLNIDQYLNVGDEVDEALYDYFLNILPPITWNRKMLQTGSVCDYVEGRGTYITFSTSRGVIRYCGECHKGELINRAS